MIVAGSSGSGKTEFVKCLIDNMQSMIVPPLKKVTWYYGIWQNGYERMQPEVAFVSGLNGLGDADGSDPLLVVVDDLMNEMDDRVLDMFTKKATIRILALYLLCKTCLLIRSVFAL